MAVANRYGFAHMVSNGIAKATEKRIAAEQRADAKHARQAAKANAKRAANRKDLTVTPMGVDLTKAPKPAVEVEPLPVPVPAIAKVGRWTYEGTVNVDGTFTYKAKLGGTKTVQDGQFTVLEA
jgi:hypothetical protein